MFEKQWALTLLSQTVPLQRLRADYEQAGKGQLFGAPWSRALSAPRETQPYAELAAQLGMTDGAVRTGGPAACASATARIA